MLTVVIGGSGSGKSAFAESAVLGYGDCKRIYVATMEIFDDECRRKVDRHRRMRQEKNFETIECPTHLEDVSVDKDSVVLVECMSNLLANEMYSNEGRKENVVDIICRGIEKLNAEAKELIVVTNDVFGDGIFYDEDSSDYIKKLGQINCRMGSIADRLYEVTNGIAVKYK